MEKGGGVSERFEDKETKIGGVANKKKMKKNMQRLGGRGGLSLAAFASAKARNDNYNPSVIMVISFQILGDAAIMCKIMRYKQLVSSAEKQREFYRNAKHVKKYKKSINQQEHRSNSFNTKELLESEDVTDGGDRASQKKMKYKKNARNLQELYEKKHDEQERGRMEKEAMMQAKKTEREAAEARRRALKEKMYKKTRSGQPVMKNRIEHMLESIHGSTT